MQGLKKLAHKHPPDDSSDLGYMRRNAVSRVPLLT